MNIPNDSMASQQSQVDLTPDEVKALLGAAVRLSEGLLAPQEMPMDDMGTEEMEPMMEEPVEDMTDGKAEEPEEVVEEPEQEEEMDAGMGEKMKEMMDEHKKELESFKGEVKGILETKLGDLTQTIKDALKED